MRTFIVCLLLMAGSAQAAFSTEPAGCLEKFAPPCSVLTQTKSEFDTPQLKIFSSKEALFQFQSAHSIYLARGILWLQTTQPLAVQSKFGTVQTIGAGQFWVELAENEMIVKSLRESISVLPRGAKDFVSLDTGHEMRVSYVNQQTHHSDYTVPMVLNLPQHLAALPKVFPYKTKKIQDYTLYLGRVVRGAAEANAEWYRQAVQRKVSSIETETVRLKYERIDNKRRDSYLRKLFRIKNNFEDQ